jgi:hypothetical protein
MELINMTVKLVSNPDYSGEEEVVVDQPINSEEYVILLKNHNLTNTFCI